MLKKLLSTTAIFAAISNTTYAAETLAIANFESAGHAAACAQVKLQLDTAAPAKTETRLKLDNGLLLSYGEICALAGDMYGDPDLPIALGGSLSEMNRRFSHAYAMLGTDPLAVSEAPKLLAVLQDEEKQLEDGMKNGEDPAEIFARMGTDHDIQWNCITGGFCPAEHPEIPQELVKKIYFLQQGRYLKLADKDFDHFGAEAWQAYSSGHSIALQMAVNAGHQQDIAKLEVAYAVNAFASHFLADAFSSGHMRTPHLMLYKTVTPSTLGSVLSAYMHKEDSESGLIVSNKNGDTWKAYGDHYYFAEINQKNRELLERALQVSADEIYNAYINGVIPDEDQVGALLPDLEKLNHDNTHLNTAPLFYWDEKDKIVKRRVLLNNANDYQWTTNWTGWGTLLELINARGLPLAAQQRLLANTDTRDDVIRRGIVTDQYITRTINVSVARQADIAIIP